MFYYENVWSDYIENAIKLLNIINTIELSKPELYQQITDKTKPKVMLLTNDKRTHKRNKLGLIDCTD